MHYAKQTYYSRIRRDSVCNTFQDPIITSVIDAKKITAWGESGFPARFLALTYDDVLLQPRFSTVRSRRDVDTGAYFARQIALKTPLISANMDTVTEARMAIAMARLAASA